MRQEQISRADRTRQARQSQRRRSDQRSGDQAAATERLRAGGGPGADVDEDLLRRIAILIDASATSNAA